MHRMMVFIYCKTRNVINWLYFLYNENEYNSIMMTKNERRQDPTDLPSWHNNNTKIHTYWEETLEEEGEEKKRTTMSVLQDLWECEYYDSWKEHFSDVSGFRCVKLIKCTKLSEIQRAGMVDNTMDMGLYKTPDWKIEWRCVSAIGFSTCLFTFLYFCSPLIKELKAWSMRIF